MKSLEEKIITILENKGALKAKDITNIINQEYGDDYDKKDINRALYYKLNSKVSQDKNYCWNIGKEARKNEPEILPITQTPLTKLSSYYIECLSKDMDAGVWNYASSKYGSPDYGQLFCLPQYSKNSEYIYDTEDVKNTINKVRRDRNRLVLQLGYLISLREVTSRAGNRFYVVEPIFLIPFDTQSFINNGDPVLQDSIPQINTEAIMNLSGLSKHELFEEIINIQDELGLNNPIEDQPNFEDLAMRLQKIRPEWMWIDSINPYELTSIQLKQTTSAGIYNAAAVFYTERSRYTQGLEKELSDFRGMGNEQYSETALGDWISGSFKRSIQEDIVLIEPIPLNDEQRHAVKKSLLEPLTVITGPPGTGKSQVVTSIVINAVYQGKTVLFASKNHKAVDVVNERVNGLTSRPVLLRLGNNELQAELSRYLAGLLSANTSKSDYAQYENSKQLHDHLSKKIIENNTLIDQLIKIRNEVDQIEQNIEPYREFFGSKLFAQFKTMTNNDFQKIENYLLQLENDLSRADKSKQSFFTQLFWFAIKSSRFEKARKTLSLFKDISELFNVSFPTQLLCEDNIINYSQKLIEVKNSVIKAKQVSLYFYSLEKLKKHKSLFQLSVESKITEAKIADNSINLWDNFLKLIPDSLSNENRKDIGDYVALLNLVVKANEEQRQPDRNIWRKFYTLQEKMSYILSCWAITSLSAKGRIPFKPSFFDLIVIDEASQCDIASALPLLYRAKRAVIIGDNKQLTHISTINENQDIQLLDKYQLEDNFLNWSYAGNSLFGLAQSICSSEDIVVLKDHHRSHADIINFSNSEFYDGTLRIATNYEKLKMIPSEPALRWINVAGKVESPAIGGSVNPIEAKIVISELKRIVSLNYIGTIGVVSPFIAQANRINDLIHQDNVLSDQLLRRNFLCDTVHKFQGDERDVIIFSPVVSQGIKKGSLLFLSRTGNLFNVAITRARAALIIVGDSQYCKSSGIKYMDRFTKYVLTNETKYHSNKKAVATETTITYPVIPTTSLVSDWEKILYNALYKEGIRTIPQYQVEQYAFDLAVITDNKKLDIEIDGERYHRNWDGELCARDQLRNKRIIELGWDVMRFWVYQIRDDLDGCVNQVKIWLNS